MIVVIAIILLPAIKAPLQDTVLKEAYSPAEQQLQELKNQINFYKILCVLLIVPALTYGIYNLIGLPESFRLTKQSFEPNSSKSFNSQEHASQLEQMLDQDSNNPSLLEQMTKVYMVKGEYKKAVEFARKRITASPDDSGALTQLADALAMEKKGNIDAEIMGILNKAIKLNNKNPVALTLSGIGFQQRGDTKNAISRWNQAVMNLPLNSELSTRVNALIRDAEQVTNPKVKTELNEVIAIIKVNLDPKLRNKITSESTLFVFLKSHDKAPPLYAVKAQIPAKFPITVELTEEDAMMGKTNLQAKDSVYAVARVSKTGSPLGKVGDIEGRSNNFQLGSSTRTIMLNRILDNDK